MGCCRKNTLCLSLDLDRVKRFPATRSCPLPFVYFLCDPLLRTSMQNHHQIEEFINYKVCSAWKDIALTICDKVLAEDEKQLIDIHDVKVICCPVISL